MKIDNKVAISLNDYISLRNNANIIKMKVKNTSNASTSTILHRSKQRLIIITIGAILLVMGFFGAVSIGSIVVNEAANNQLTPQGYPETAFLGISAFSWEYALVFTTILGVFVLSGGLLMDSKKKRLKNNNNNNS